MNRPHKNHNHPLRLTAGWCGLLLYVAACSPVGLGCAALVGSLDGTHQVILAAGERGGRIVLHHAPRCIVHQHGAAARALTLFAQASTAAEPDHVLRFSTADAVKIQGENAAPQPPADGQLSACGLVADFSLTPPACLSRIALHPPPGDGSALSCLRTTVLLI
jgi:hypothetical protein